MKEELKETVRSITPKFLLLYITGSVVLSILSGLLVYNYNFSSGVGAALTAINLSASLFIFGVPFVMGAALLLPSFKLSKDNTSEPYKNLNAWFLTVSRFLVLFVLSTIFTITWILLSYYLVILNSYVSTELILVYLPGTIISGLILASILSAVTTFIATLIDDWKLALIANLALFFILWVAFGFVSRLTTYDTLAIFGPYHLYRFLALAASGYVVDPVYGVVWENSSVMRALMGINFGFFDVLISVGLWISLSVILIIITQYPMSQNISRLRIESDLNRFAPGDQKLLKQIKESKQFLRQRRLAFGTVLVIILIIIPLLRFSVTFAIEEEATQTLYDGEMTLPLGFWAYGEVEIPSPPEGLNNMYQLRVEILDWGNCPDELERWAMFEEMSIENFEALNETEKDDLAGTHHPLTPARTEVGTGFSSIQSTGTHLWAFKFVPAEGYPLEGALYIKITVIVRVS
ncbi:MAG: hypothetical protein ACTSQZ_00855 [Candidatus Thorarchaeota archaeon]